MLRRHQVAAATIASTLAATAACAGGDPDSLAAGDTTLAVKTGSTMTASTTTTPSLPDLASLPLADFEPDDDTELREFVTPALGGVRFSVSEDHTPAISHDTVLVFTEPPKARINEPRSTAAIALVTQSVAGSAVSTVDDYLGAVESVEGVVVEPTGDAIELFGRRLRGYEISSDFELGEPTLFSSARFGAPVDTEFAPLPYAIVYLDDTPAGVLTASISGSDEPHARQSSDAFATLLSTTALTGPGLDRPLPPGEVIESSADGAPPTPAPLIDDAPPALETAFAPIDPGSYQLPNVGRRLTIDIDDGWFAQPNFPGIVVLTAPGSVGPGDRDLVMISDVVEYLVTEAGPRRGGASTAVASVDTLIAAPPPGFDVTEVSDRELAGASVTRFDLTTDPDATCALGEPCEAALVTSYGFVKPLAAGFDHRIWWITHDTGPATVFIAMALDDPDFIDRATTLVDTVTFI
jgi:hypothetical protein